MFSHNEINLTVRRLMQDKDKTIITFFSTSKSSFQKHELGLLKAALHIQRFERAGAATNIACVPDHLKRKVSGLEHRLRPRLIPSVAIASATMGVELVPTPKAPKNRSLVIRLIAKVLSTAYAP